MTVVDWAHLVATEAASYTGRRSGNRSPKICKYILYYYAMHTLLHAQTFAFRFKKKNRREAILITLSKMQNKTIKLNVISRISLLR